MRTEPLPLIILTGFLGSGKTSTLQHWLEHTKTSLKRTAIIINDFGAVNVDATLLARRQLELRSITGGCICCQSFEDLVAEVDALAKNSDLDLAWIETSGLADPEEVLDHLSAPELQERTLIRRVVLVIDASDFPCSWRGQAVQNEQIRYADLILLNKGDLLDATALGKIEAAVRELNPAAQIVATRRGQIEPTLLTGEGARTGSVPHHSHDHEPCAHEGPCEHDHHDNHDHHHEGHSHEEEALPHAASTFFVPLDHPVERTSFERFLAALPESVFRAKGFVRLSDSPEKLHTFQRVRDQGELLLLPLEADLSIPTGLVFIGPHLDEARIRTLAQAINLTHA